MRALASIVAFVVCSCCMHAFASSANLDIKKQGPAHRLLTCGRTLGLPKCFNALSVWRAERAVQALKTGRAVQFDAVEDARRFPWEQYSNSSDEQLYSQLCDGTEKLLQYRSLSLSLPGYSLELESKGNGTLNVDILKNYDIGSGRDSMKKMQNQFYSVLPLLLLPGLIMSAILPFVLPALKMMTVGVVMLNNMALSGAVFTLLRNNAFSDKYEHKIIYVNEGYNNEKISPVYMHDENQFEQVEMPLEFSSSNVKGVLTTTDDLVEIPSNADFINQYYGNEGMSLVRRSQKTPEILKTPENIGVPEKVSRRKSRV